MKRLPQLIPFPGAPARESAAEGTEVAEVAEVIAVAGIAESAESAAASATTAQRAAREESLAQTLAAVRNRWGYGSIVRLDRAGAFAAAAPHARRPKSAHELPPWWPRPAGAKVTGSLLRPRLLEVAGEAGSGRLTLALAWLAAARPTLAAFVDPTAAPIHGTAPAPNPKSKIQNPKSPLAWPERFYPPAAAAAGIDLSRLVVVCPPAGDPRAPLDAVAVLLRSEAFDVILCPLPARARISTSFAGKLATLAARAATSLLLLTQPSLNSTSDWGAQPRHWSEGLGGLRTSDYPGALGAFADYRVRLTARRWLWEDGELAGMKLRVTTERARAAAMAEVEDATGGAVEHELTFRLHRRVRYGASAADRLSLTTSTRLPSAAEEPAAEETGDTMVQPLALSGARSR